MSWNYSQELVAAYLQANYSDIERCVQSNSTSTVDIYLYGARMMDC